MGRSSDTFENLGFFRTGGGVLFLVRLQDVWPKESKFMLESWMISMKDGFRDAPRKHITLTCNTNMESPRFFLLQPPTKKPSMFGFLMSSAPGKVAKLQGLQI